MSEPVLCKDCKHSFRTISSFLVFGTGIYAWKCRLSFKPEHYQHNNVTKPTKIKAGYENCSMSRIDSKICGKEGKNWEPKNKRDLFTYIKHVSN